MRVCVLCRETDKKLRCHQGGQTNYGKNDLIPRVTYICYGDAAISIERYNQRTDTIQ